MGSCFSFVQKFIVDDEDDEFDHDPSPDDLRTEPASAAGISNAIVSNVVTLCKGKPQLAEPSRERLITLLLQFFTMNSWDNKHQALDNFQIFNSSSAPLWLVKLYTSSNGANQADAYCTISQFLTLCKCCLPKITLHCSMPIVLEFCTLLLVRNGVDDPLFRVCLSSLVELIELQKGTLNELQDLDKFVVQLATTILYYLDGRAKSPEFLRQCLREARNFGEFLVLVRSEITRLAVARELHDSAADQAYEAIRVHAQRVFFSLVSKLNECMMDIEVENDVTGCGGYIAFLMELNSISKLYCCEGMFLDTMERRKAAVDLLTISFCKKDDDYRWIFAVKEGTCFSTRRHLAMMMLPELKDDLDMNRWMVTVNRSNLLLESFNQITRAGVNDLRAGIRVAFMNELGVGFGVIREWFLLVCREIFNPVNKLFVACPRDRRRFFPSAASKANPLHLKYLRFSGRVIALALMYKIQVGIAFDRVFFLHLAGKDVSLEDIQDADPTFYRSCKQILEMDPDIVDRDVLGLTFVHDIEESGKKKSIELLPQGSSMVVDSKNRKQYVDCLIKHIFVSAISKQVALFAFGFDDVLSEENRKSFFEYLYPEDLNMMLRGSESEISLEDWRAHTRYYSFKRTDPQISWFWEVVGTMTNKQKRRLLFFWTSIEYLPLEGFRGLASNLCIEKASTTLDHLPSSQTCYYTLTLPAYDSRAVMYDRLHMITQKHIASGFGNS